jgi:hypothetical protein
LLDLEHDADRRLRLRREFRAADNAYNRARYRLRHAATEEKREAALADFNQASLALTNARKAMFRG